MDFIEELYLNATSKKDYKDSEETQDAYNAICEALKDLNLDKTNFTCLDNLIIDYSVALEQQGFIAGFKTATSIWKEC